MAMAKKTFVLIHGAWFGGWVWRDTLNRLRAVGHIATAPTLTGLGERSHLNVTVAGLSEPVSVASQNTDRLRSTYNTGDAVTLSWPTDAMVILPRE